MIVGLTGGIGSGKSTVAKFFKELGVPVYIADLEAKKLMETNDDIRRDIISIFGADAYEKLEQLNAIIHPAVGKHFEEWYQQQKVPYVIKEVAILFENGGDKQCDLVITVTAPKEIRIERVLKRDQTTRKAIEARMQNQWSDKEKIKKSDFVIENIVIDNTHQIVEELHRMILKKSI